MQFLEQICLHEKCYTQIFCMHVHTCIDLVHWDQVLKQQWSDNNLGGTRLTCFNRLLQVKRKEHISFVPCIPHCKYMQNVCYLMKIFTMKG